MATQIPDHHDTQRSDSPSAHNQFQQAASALCNIGKVLYERNWSPATSSNYSIRIDHQSCAITSSGRHKGQLAPEHILLVDMQGQPLSTGKPSAETLLHTQIYRRDPSQGAVLHTHSPTAVLLSHIVSDNFINFTGWELQKAFHGETSHEGLITVPIFDNNQNIAELADLVENHMQSHGQGHAYLIRGHGLYTWGTDLNECFRHLEALEHLLNYQLQLMQLGHRP